MLLKKETQNQLPSPTIDCLEEIISKEKQKQELRKITTFKMDQFEKGNGVAADQKISPTSLHGNDRPSNEKDREKVN